MYGEGDLVGNYRLEKVIGRGGMGVVWKATDLNQDQLVAIKMIANDPAADSGFLGRIQDEARRHQRLEHANIARIIEVIDCSGNTCIVMELIHGDSLAALLDRQPEQRIPEDRARYIIKGILKGLDFAHSRYVIWHRDIKPSNIILEANDHARIIDFGIALAYGEERRTRTGQLVGSADYMSPEQITRPKEINHLTDVYSVGCLLYEMLTGRPPFVRGEDGVSNTEFSVQQAHVNKKPLPPKKRNMKISDDINQIVMDSLEKKFKNRIPGCGAFLLRLEQPRLPKREIVKIKPAQVWVLVLVLLLLFLLIQIYRGV